MSSWRTYLDDLFSGMSPDAKRTLLQRVGVSRTTMLRWRNEDGHVPNAEHLALLLTYLPEENRVHFLGLLRDDPRISLPSEISEGTLFTTAPIPGSLYTAILRLQRETEIEDFWGSASEILRQAIQQLAQAESHLEILVVRCMPPRRNGYIQSLCGSVCIGTGPLRTDIHEKVCFLGAESLAGMAVMQKRWLVIPDLSDPTTFASVHSLTHQQSAVAYPIYRSQRIAGALLAVSTVSHFFTRRRLAMIEAYTDLLRLVFREQEFYPVTVINLAHLPSWTEQQPLLERFHSLVDKEHRELFQQGQPVVRGQVEQAIRQCLEEELLDDKR